MTTPIIRNAYADTRRGQLHYKTSGTGPAVVLLQILPFSTRLLEPLLTAVAEAGYAGYAFDLMGYGRSSPRDGAWSVEDFAANLGEGLDALAITPLGTVSGHFTAMVATELALRAPAKVGRLVIDGAPLWSRDVAAQRLKAVTCREAWTEDGAALLRDWTTVVTLLKKFDPDLSFAPDNQEALFAAFSHFVEIGLRPGATRAIMDYDLEAALVRLGSPVLIIGSPTDSLRANHEAALALVPGAQAHLFETTHPLYPLDRPERAQAYLDVIDPFLRG